MKITLFLNSTYDEIPVTDVIRGDFWVGYINNGKRNWVPRERVMAIVETPEDEDYLAKEDAVAEDAVAEDPIYAKYGEGRHS